MGLFINIEILVMIIIQSIYISIHIIKYKKTPNIIDNMQELRTALQDLIAGYPKQATATIQLQMNTDEHFFNNLTILITGDNQQQQLSGKMLTAAIVTLNSLALRVRNKVEIKDFLTLQQIYSCIKYVLACPSINFQNKKLLSPALSELLSGACSTHKQVLQLKNYLKQCTNESPSLIFLNSIISTKSIAKPVQIQCILQLFPLALQQIQCYTYILNNSELQQLYKQQNNYNNNNNNRNISNGNWYQNKINVPTVQSSFTRIKYFVQLIKAMFQTIMNDDKIGNLQSQAIQILTSSSALTQLLFGVLQWINPVRQQYRYAWTQDIKIGNYVIQYYQVNNMKQKCFLVLSYILNKTDPQYNLHHTLHPLFNRIPTLYTQICQQLINISHNFRQQQQNYLIGSLCDSMLIVIAQALKLNDIYQMYIMGNNNSNSNSNSNSSNNSNSNSNSNNVSSVQEFVQMAMVYVGVRDTDISGDQDGDYFVQFIQGFAGSYNFNQITRYSISEFIKSCFNKLDTFPSIIFARCYNSIISQLQHRIPQNQDCYSHLLIPIMQNQPRNSNKSQTNRQTIQTSLLGLIIMQQQINYRKDFRQALKQFIIVLDITHLKGAEICLIYYILGRHLNIFQMQYMADIGEKYVHHAFIIAQQSQNNSIICFQFVKLFYCSFICNTQIQHQISGKLINIAQRTVWNQLILAFNQSKLMQNEYFYNILNEILSFHRLCQNGNQQQNDKNDGDELLRIQTFNGSKTNYTNFQIKTVGDYLIKQISKFLIVILHKSTTNKVIIMKQKDHEQLISLRLHQVILECLTCIQWVNKLDQRTASHIQFQNYCKLLQKMIIDVMEFAQQCNQLTIQQVLQQVQIVSVLVAHERTQKQSNNIHKISQQVFQSIFDALMRHPFGSCWLVCICEFIHRNHQKITLDQHQKIRQLLQNNYKNIQSLSEQKLSELLLMTVVLLNYEQPEGWSPIHEIIRVHFIKLLKVEAQQSRIQRQKKMLQLGFQSQNILGITTIRLFHVYLFGFRIESVNELLWQILTYFQKYIQKYNLIEAAHFIAAFRSSYRQMGRQNFEKLLDIVVAVLNKLVKSNKFYGNQSHEQINMRKLSQKIGCMTADPYTEFRKFVNQLELQGVNLLDKSNRGITIRSLFGINTCKGQPRKLFSIVRPKQ